VLPGSAHATPASITQLSIGPTSPLLPVVVSPSVVVPLAVVALDGLSPPGSSGPEPASPSLSDPEPPPAALPDTSSLDTFGPQPIGREHARDAAMAHVRAKRIVDR
jgi:hypothetical protein